MPDKPSCALPSPADPPESQRSAARPSRQRLNRRGTYKEGPRGVSARWHPRAQRASSTHGPVRPPPRPRHTVRRSPPQENLPRLQSRSRHPETTPRPHPERPHGPADPTAPHPGRLPTVRRPRQHVTFSDLVRGDEKQHAGPVRWSNRTTSDRRTIGPTMLHVEHPPTGPLDRGIALPPTPGTHGTPTPRLPYRTPSAPVSKVDPQIPRTPQPRTES